MVVWMNLLEEIDLTAEAAVKKIKTMLQKNKKGHENMKVMKERLDVLLVEQGLAETREKAKRMIMAGLFMQMKKDMKSQAKKYRLI